MARRCHNCTCCEDTQGRLLAVAEKLAGSVTAEDFAAPGVFGALTDGAAGTGWPSAVTLTMTVAQDQVGDCMVVLGGNQAGPVPTGCVDSKGNTYYLDNVIHGTFGLDGTVWMFRGEADVARLEAGDTIILTGYDDGLGDVAPASSAAMTLDVQGIRGSQASVDDGLGAHGGDSSYSFAFGFASTFHMNDGTLAQANEIYCSVSYGHAQAAVNGTPPGFFGASFSHGGVAAGLVTDTTVPDLQGSANGDPPAWGQGLAFAYKTTSEADMLLLVDVDAFSEDGGQAEIIDPETGDATPFTYTGVDEDLDALIGVSGLDGSFAAGAIVNVLPHAVLRYASLQIDGEDDLIQARIPHYLFDRIPLDTKDVNAAKAYTVYCRLVTDGWIITDVYGETPVIDGSFIDPTTLPTPSDGYPPASPSPTPDLVAGDDHIKARWAAVTLNSNGDPQTDLVAYDVHIVADADPVAASLTAGTGDATYRLTAVTAGDVGNSISLTVTTS